MAEITLKKIKNLHNIIIREEYPELIASKLGVRKGQPEQWLKMGEDYIEKYDLILSDSGLYDIDIPEMEENEIKNKVKYMNDFLIEHEFETINNKNKKIFEEYFEKKSGDFIEDQVYKKEDEILDELKFDLNPDKNYLIKLYIKFCRVWERAKARSTSRYLKNCQYHSGSSKNVGISKEKLKEEFNIEEKVNHTISGQISIVDLMMELSKTKENK